MSEPNPQTRLIWHHKLHQDWANERLFFWRLGFSPTYDRPAILERLRSVFAELRILSYGIYESTGETDLFMRVWLPIGITEDQFEESLFEMLSTENIQRCDPFAVSNVHAHWIWSGADSENDSTAPDVGNRLPDADIERINSCDLSQDELNKYSSQNLVRVWQPHPGIRLIIFIPRPAHSLTLKARKRLKDRLYATLAQAPFFHNVSLYEGVGFAQFFMLGTIEPTEFDKLNGLINDINSVGVEPAFEVRTFTHIIVASAGIDLPLLDCMPLSEQVPHEESVGTQLARGESDSLEVKASLFVNVNQWLHTGKMEVDQKIANEGALKSIVAFLNTNGGKVVLGAFETKRATQSEAKDRLSEYPECGEFTILGVDLDCKARNIDADSFQLQLKNLIRDRIEPSCMSWLSIRMEQLHGRELCVIDVRRVMADNWFYLRLKQGLTFYVREGNETRPRTGPEADEYKKQNPR